LLFVLLILNVLTVAAITPKPYVGNKSTKVYHISSCTYSEKISSANRAYFNSRSEAERNGYRRCYYCGDDVIEAGQSDVSTEKPQGNSQKSLGENTLTRSLFICGIPAILLTVAMYYLSIFCDKRHYVRISRIARICMVIFGIIAFPCAFCIAAIIFALVGFVAIIVTIVKALTCCIRKLLHTNKDSNMIHIHVPTFPKECEGGNREKELSEDSQEPVYCMEAANGMMVRVPQSQLEAWQAEQERQLQGEGLELTEQERKMKEAILEKIYGSKRSPDEN